MGLDQSKVLGADYPIAMCQCRIVVVGAKSGDTSLLALSNLPPEARIIATGNNLAEIKKDGEMYSEASLMKLFILYRVLFFQLNNQILVFL